LGQISTGKIITVVVIFLLVSVFVYRKPEPAPSIKEKSLDQVLRVVDGWKADAPIPYDKKVVDSLALDDYVNKTFTKNDNTISLYIGYYLTTGKVGAAHDPLVCFPGQGWAVSNRDKGTIKVGDGAIPKVSYSTMMVEQGAGSKLKVLYWFQAYETANADTLSQKISSMLQKFTGAGEDNAFVRLTCATTVQTESECMETMQEFTKAFYPIFLKYIRE
jgi:EpsI family protein